MSSRGWKVLAALIISTTIVYAAESLKFSGWIIARSGPEQGYFLFTSDETAEASFGFACPRTLTRHYVFFDRTIASPESGSRCDNFFELTIGCDGRAIEKLSMCRGHKVGMTPARRFITGIDGPSPKAIFTDIRVFEAMRRARSHCSATGDGIALDLPIDGIDEALKAYELSCKRIGAW